MSFKITWISCESRNTHFVGGHHITAGVIKMQGDLPYVDATFTAWGDTVPVVNVSSNQQAFEDHYDNMWLNPGYIAMRGQASYLTLRADDHEWGGDNWDHTLTQSESQSPIGATDQEGVNTHYLTGLAALTAQGAIRELNPPTFIDDGGEYPPQVDDATDYSNFANKPLVTEYTAQYGKQYFDVNGVELPTATGAKVVIYDIDCIARRSPTADTDNSSKTMLGSIQKAWIKSEVVTDSPLVDLIIISNGKKWRQSNPVGTSDNWGVYGTERLELENHWDSNGVDNLIIIAGDQHRAEVSAGTYPCFVACPNSTLPSSQNFLPNKNTYVYADWSDRYMKYGTNFGEIEINDNGYTVALNRSANAASLYKTNMSYGSNALNYDQLTTTKANHMADIIIGLSPETANVGALTTPSVLSTTQATSSGREYAITVPVDYEIYEIGIYGSSNSGGATRDAEVAVYTDGGSGTPTNILAGSKQTLTLPIDGASGIGMVSVTDSTVLAIPAGDYAIALVSTSSFINVANNDNFDGSVGASRDTGTGGVLPATWNETATPGNQSLVVWARLRTIGAPTVTTPYPDLVNMSGDVVSVDLNTNIDGESSLTVEFEPAIPSGLSEVSGVVTGTVTSPTSTARCIITASNSLGTIVREFQWTTLTIGAAGNINLDINPVAG